MRSSFIPRTRRHFAPRKDKRSVVPLAVTSQTFTDMFARLNLPAVFLRLLVSGLPMALRFDPRLYGGTEGSSSLTVCICDAAANHFFFKLASYFVQMHSLSPNIRSVSYMIKRLDALLRSVSDCVKGSIYSFWTT